jgi:NCAIR mutase (PurE)-related protein
MSNVRRKRSFRTIGSARMIDPFDDVISALQSADSSDSAAGDTRVDGNRAQRTGVPEIVLAEGKDDDALVAACTALLKRLDRVVVSRLATDRAQIITARVPFPLELLSDFPGRTVVLSRPGSLAPPRTGRIAVLTAGASDIGVAGEAATVVRESGCHVEIIADIGVAGLHRLVSPLRRVIAEGADAIIVAAGMDGALPSVVAGLVDVPVIGLPTSVGYGVAAGGHSALMTMLSSCAPGLVVVNIDNGVGAAAAAVKIARRVHQSRG